MKRAAWLILLFVPVTLTTAQAAPLPANFQSDIPYIYYYSGALNGVVIERADGTDSRIIGQGLVDEEVLFVYGPGWSPDGRWFAWRVETPEAPYSPVGKGYVASADGQTTLEILGRFQCVHSMLWHPTENILFVYGSRSRTDRCPQLAHPVATYWLIDVDAQTRLATFSIDSEMEWHSTPPIYWFPEGRQIRFLEGIWINTQNGSSLQEFLVTMSFDGTVTMEPVSTEVADARFEGIAPDRTAYEDRQLTLFSSWTEAAQGEQIEPPPNSSAVGSAVSGQWDSAGDWLFVGYEFCWSDCAFVTGRVNILNPASGQNREISDCGAHPTCVGWLPELVDLANLPPGQPESVLPSPESMDYSNPLFWDNGPGYLKGVATHEIVCDMDVHPPVLSLVQNKSTGEIDFVIPNGGPCGEPVQREPEFVFPTKPVVFALSPNGKYYAITDDTEYTSLFDAETGDRIATLNFYGIELSFSEDSRYLITTGRFATATWDIEKLVPEI